MEDYTSWFKQDKPCEGRKKRNGFDPRKCRPPDFSRDDAKIPCTPMALKPTSSPSQASVETNFQLPTKPTSNVTVSELGLHPLDKRYVACTHACQHACLEKPILGKRKCKGGCCKPWGSFTAFETLAHDHVAFFPLRCAGNINHDFHQNFWPLYWWTSVYAQSNSAILVQREADRNPNCPSSHWTDDLFWKVSREKKWKVYNLSKEKEYCITGTRIQEVVLHNVSSWIRDPRSRSTL